MEKSDEKIDLKSGNLKISPKVCFPTPWSSTPLGRSKWRQIHRRPPLRGLPRQRGVRREALGRHVGQRTGCGLIEEESDSKSRDFVEFYSDSMGFEWNFTVIQWDLNGILWQFNGI